MGKAGQENQIVEREEYVLVLRDAISRLVFLQNTRLQYGASGRGNHTTMGLPRPLALHSDGFTSS